MLNIIKNCPENSFDQLTDFLVNFFYENTIDCSFREEELSYYPTKIPHILKKMMILYYCRHI